MPDLKHDLQQKLGPALTVERELPGAGMSRVFVARDESLGRRVVVKVLPAELAASVSVDRFKREILLAATLQHPHIVGVLTAGEIDGMPYFMMPFVEGESLRARIQREGPLPVGRAVSILKDVARALAFAHDHGVVHRDIKPDNVLLAGASATVTDFGIAKAVLGSLTPGVIAQKNGGHDAEQISRSTTGSSAPLTQLGTTLGTPAYMAPEQAAGDPETDHRADIYSFGIMAYEMLTGQVPFKSKTPQALLAAQLTATPQPIAALRADVPAALTKLVMQCLEKEREKRPPTAHVLAEELENPEMVSGAFASAAMLAARPRKAILSATLAVAALLAAIIAIVSVRAKKTEAQLDTMRAPRAGTGAPAATASDRARSIVVLPFVNIGRDSTDDYLADGLTSDLINALGRVRGLRVASRSTAGMARAKYASSAEIGRAINVGRILEGTIQRSGDRLRVTARVTNTDDGFMVWSDMFERTLKDVFAVQDEISSAIAEALGAQMGAVTASAFAQRGTANDSAYDLYLRGRHFLEQRGEASLRHALDLFRRAAKMDPAFARAYAGIANVYSVLPLYARSSADSLLEQGMRGATKAIALDSNLAEAYASRAVLLTAKWRWNAAEQDYRRALALDPASAAAHQWYGEQLMIRNRIPESLDHLKRAADAEPVSPVIASSYSMALALAGRDAEALAQARRAVDFDSEFFLPRLVVGYDHLMAHRAAAAIPELEQALGLSRGLPYVKGMLGYAYAAAGQRQNAEALGQQLAASKDAEAQASVAIVQLGLRDTAKALASLTNAARAHAPLFTALPLASEMFDSVRASGRFHAIVRVLGLEP